MKKYLFLMIYVTLFGTFVYAQGVEQNQAELNNVIEAVAPDFPSSAVILNLSSKIFVQVIVNSEGKVITAKINSGHPLFKWEVERVSNLWLFETSTEEVRHFTLVFDFIFMKYDGKEDKQIIAFKPPFEVKILKMISLKVDNRIPHPPAIIKRKKSSK
jgi:hypothetical protein